MLIVANWKAYVEDEAKAKRLYAAAKRLAAGGRHEIVLAPAAPYLGEFASANRSSVAFAAQDISETTGGAATGEVTAAINESVGATYAIVGHSERRAKGETDAMVLEKVRHALANGLTPILCVGERERDPEAKYLSFLRGQLSAVFEPLSLKERSRIVLAYEPVWAIGKGAAEAITPADLGEMVLYIRKVLGSYKGAGKVRILYGGSVDPSNIRALAVGGGVDGFLIGHASTEVQSFGALVKAVN